MGQSDDTAGPWTRKGYIVKKNGNLICGIS
jgi:hypothetical protein